MPNFLVIGAPKAGTTSLYKYLEQHPQIYMSPVKEPSFFALEGKDLDVLPSGNHSVTVLEKYQLLFQGVTEEIAIGEASTTYLYSPKAAERIKYYTPDVKLIAILRNPVDRAFSNYKMIMRDQPLSLQSFSKEIEDEEPNLVIRRQEKKRPITPYIGGGFYYKLLKRYFDEFDNSQIKIYLYEEFTQNTVQVMQDIFDFLNIDDTFLPDVSQKYNVSQKSRENKAEIPSPLLSTSNTINFIKQLLSWGNMQDSPNDMDIHSSFNKIELSPELRKKLIEIYREDIEKLQHFLNKDLSSWLT
ncbi:MAG: sulfotransferase [Crocosphaera sp.]|nr:sulfotransferase [Crocosphaera sp.]